jgi:hypothetical protein
MRLSVKGPTSCGSKKAVSKVENKTIGEGPKMSSIERKE